jgi:hypothetical protein
MAARAPRPSTALACTDNNIKVNSQPRPSTALACVDKVLSPPGASGLRRASITAPGKQKPNVQQARRTSLDALRPDSRRASLEEHAPGNTAKNAHLTQVAAEMPTRAQQRQSYRSSKSTSLGDVKKAHEHGSGRYAKFCNTFFYTLPVQHPSG